MTSIKVNFYASSFLYEYQVPNTVLKYLLISLLMQVHPHQVYSFRILAGVELEQRESVKILSIKALAI